MLDLEHVVGLVLDDVRNRVAVRGTNSQRPEYQQVERPLEHLPLNGLISSFGHGLQSILQKIIYGNKNSIADGKSLIADRNQSAIRQ